MSYTPLPVKTSTTGPKIMTAVGVLLLLVAVAAVVLVVRLFMSVLPLGIVAADGAPGSEAVGGTDVPGTVMLSLAADTTYAVYLTHPSGIDGVELSDRVSIIGPYGQEAQSAAAPSSSVSRQGVAAADVQAFHTGQAGDYTVTVPELADPDRTPWATVVVAPADDIPGFVGGVFGTIAGAFVAIGSGALGVALTLAGAIWWYGRRQAGQRVAAGQQPIGPPPGMPGPPPPGMSGPPPGAPGSNPWA